MYETCFNFTERPFAAVPRPEHYFPTASSEAARANLARCVERAEGVGMLVGPSGTGKTLLCQILADQFRPSLCVALLPSGHLSTRRALLQAILYELNQPYRGMDEGELRLALTDYVTLHDDCQRGVVLLVDEAHNLPLRLLDEIRMLTNLLRGGQPAVRLVVAGGRSLEERFANPKLDSFSQRLTARCYLEPLQRAETESYIHTRIAAANGNGPQVFLPEACHSVYKATDGVPRLINQVCDHVLLLACAAGWQRIEPAHVEEAWADLQQLPTPWNEAAKNVAASVIEFGGLDDEPEAAPPEAAPDDSTPLLRISPNHEEPEARDMEPADQIHNIQQMLSEADEEFQPAGTIGPEVELVFDDPSNPFREQFVEEEVICERHAPAASPPPAAPPAPAAAHPAAPLADGPSPTVPLHREPPALPEPDDSDMIIIEEGYDDGPALPARSVVPVRKHEYGRLFAKLRRGGT